MTRRFPIKFLTDQEQAAISIVLMEHVSHFPEHKTDPTFKGLFRKFNVDIDTMLRGLDSAIKGKIESVLADLRDTMLTSDEIANRHGVPVGTVEEIQRLSKQRGEDAAP